jgi:uncharacterized integral membrane protein
MIILNIFFSLTLVVLSMIFSFQNLLVVQVKFLLFEFQSPVGLLIVASFLFGVVIPVGILLPIVLTKNLKIRKLEKEKENINKRLDDSGILFESSGLGNEGEKYKNNNN